jgi:hypothetical protein
MCVQFPKDRDGQEVHIGFRVEFQHPDGRTLEGRVRAYDGWGKLQVVVIHAGGIPLGHEVESKDATVTVKGW